MSDSTIEGMECVERVRLVVLDSVVTECDKKFPGKEMGVMKRKRRK